LLAVLAGALDGLDGTGVAEAAEVVEEAAVVGRLAVVVGAGVLVTAVLLLGAELDGGWLVTGAAAPVFFEADEQAVASARTAHSSGARRER
jgi:carbonic anhydrase/acetyltransferase-like protein (isoleucine patch superfamily)